MHAFLPCFAHWEWVYVCPTSSALYLAQADKPGWTCPCILVGCGLCTVGRGGVLKPLCHLCHLNRVQDSPV